MLKAGFVALIGRSNVGKSTLVNGLVGSKVAITTPKAQTTRQPIQGILSEERGQIVFVDTPGIMQKARDPLTKKLLEFVHETLRGIDVVCYVADPTRPIGNEEHQALQMIESLTVPKVLVLNKCDLRQRPHLASYLELANRFDEVIEISAKRGTHLEVLKEYLFEKISEGEPYYEPGELSNLPRNTWIAELIREKLFLRLNDEIPYSLHVEVDEIAERPNDLVYIHAMIYCNESRYKKIIIGHQGRGLKEVGQSARRELETVLQRPIFLDLTVEVDPHWIEKL